MLDGRNHFYYEIKSGIKVEYTSTSDKGCHNITLQYMKKQEAVSNTKFTLLKKQPFHAGYSTSN